MKIVAHDKTRVVVFTAETPLEIFRLGIIAGRVGKECREYPPTEERQAEIAVNYDNLIQLLLGL